MQLIRSVEIVQPDFQWQYQLRHERDVTAQVEAARAILKFPTVNSKKALSDVIENEQCYFRVRCEATHCLAKVTTDQVASSSEGTPVMLALFKKMFSSFSDSNIIKQNNFSDLQLYFLQKVRKSVQKFRKKSSIKNFSPEIKPKKFSQKIQTKNSAKKFSQKIPGRIHSKPKFDAFYLISLVLY